MGETYVGPGITYSYILALSQDDFLSLEWEQSTNIKDTRAQDII